MRFIIETIVCAFLGMVIGFFGLYYVCWLHDHFIEPGWTQTGWIYTYISMPVCSSMVTLAYVKWLYIKAHS